MTQAYKSKGYRQLHRAIAPAELTPEQIDRKFLRELAKDIDEGWKYFWSGRSRKPYRVSKHNVGMLICLMLKRVRLVTAFECNDVMHEYLFI